MYRVYKKIYRNGEWSGEMVWIGFLTDSELQSDRYLLGGEHVHCRFVTDLMNGLILKLVKVF